VFEPDISSTKAWSDRHCRCQRLGWSDRNKWPDS
jgi:hypothetical protein